MVRISDYINELLALNRCLPILMKKFVKKMLSNFCPWFSKSNMTKYEVTFLNLKGFI